MRIPYYHVDSFTDELFAGNPAGVCILESFPSPKTMQQIAAENRHSETAFVVRRPDGDFDLRWFTPEVEDDLCGHATLAAAHVLAINGQKSWPLRFHTCSGVLGVDRDGDEYVMDFPARPPQPCKPPDGLLRALGLDKAEVMKSERDYLVIVDRETTVKTLSPNIRDLAKFDIGIGGVIVTAPADSRDLDYVVRFFPPSVGIDEDPATGSIQCTLAPYWASRLGKNEFRVRQLSPRGGKMRSALAGDRVKIAGAARLYLRGEIEV